MSLPPEPTSSAEDSTKDAGFDEKELTHYLFGICMEVYQGLGPGLNRSAYQKAIAQELRSREFFFEENKPLPVEYNGSTIENAATANFLIEDKLVLEVLAQNEIESTDRRRMKSVLGLSGNKTGLLVNFNVSELRHGLVKVVISNNHSSQSDASKERSDEDKEASAKTW